MNKNRDAYLIPDTPNPENKQCLLVFIPDDPLYLYQFMDAYEYFGKWVAWERDEAKRGKVAASSWRDAIECTRSFMANCGADLALSLSKIADAIENRPCCDSQTLVNVNTPVTVTIPPNETGQDPPYDTTPEGDPNVDPPPDGYDDWPDYYDKKCLAANWFADEMIRMVSKLEGVGDFIVVGGVAVSAAIALLVLVFAPEVVAALGMFKLIELTATMGTLAGGVNWSFNQFRDDIAPYMESHKEELVCILYSWTNGSEIGSGLPLWFQLIVSDLKTTLGWSSVVSDTVLSILNKLYGSRLINWYIDNIATVPEGYVGTIDCAACGCPSYRQIIKGSGDITGLGVRTLTAVDNGSGLYELAFQLDGNYCVEMGYTPDPTWGYFSVQTCDNGELLEGDFPATPNTRFCMIKFATSWNQPFTMDVNIIESNPNCEPCVGQTFFDFNDGVQGWVFVPRDLTYNYYHGEWASTGGEDGTGGLRIYTDNVAVTRSGIWRLDLSSYGVVVASGFSVTARLKAEVLPGNVNNELSVYFTDGTRLFSNLGNNATWQTLTTSIGSAAGKTISKVELYSGQSGSTATGLSQVWDNVTLNIV